MIRWLVSYCFCLLLAPSVLAAQTNWDSSGFAEYLESKRDAWDVPGLAVAVVTSDRVLFNEGIGTLQVDLPERVDAETLFAIASNTKAYCAATLAILVERGLVRWDDRVQSILSMASQSACSLPRRQR
ncbi:MAG: serine hydrolase domain-containing protein [Planctomycetota bacterium]